MTAEERFELDLLDSGRSWGVTLEKDVARKILVSLRRDFSVKNYRNSRDLILLEHLPEDYIESEFEAYKDFFDLNFQRLKNDARALRERPFAPLTAYKDDLR